MPRLCTVGAGCIAPAFDDFNEGGKRAARGEDGKTTQVPDDMTYRKWENMFVEGDSGFNERERASIKPPKGEVPNQYYANLDVINTQKYAAKFENLTGHKNLDNGLLKKAREIIEHR